MKRFALTLSLIVIALSGCVSPHPTQPVTAVNESKITVLAYNVENLFDTEDDPDKNDETFLPADLKKSAIYQNKCRVQSSNAGQARECLQTDWSPRVLARKLSRLTDVVAQVENGRGPDILIVEEVESRAVLEQWRNQYMSKMGYRTLAFVKGPDVRGINPAIFSRLPIIDEPTLHEIDFATVEPNPRPSRGILEAHLLLPDGETLVVFAVHFPSQSAPTPFRKVAVQTLLDEIQRKPPGTNILVGGDFNISAKEEYKEKLFKDQIGKVMTVSHLAGCHDCSGTIFYPRDGTWSFFDVLLFSKSLSDGSSAWHLAPESIQVVNSSIYQKNRYGTPARFGSGRGPVGVSDHWPMYAELHAQPQITGAHQ